VKIGDIDKLVDAFAQEAGDPALLVAVAKAAVGQYNHVDYCKALRDAIDAYESSQASPETPFGDTQTDLCPTDEARPMTRGQQIDALERRVADIEARNFETKIGVIFERIQELEEQAGTTPDPLSAAKDAVCRAGDNQDAARKVALEAAGLGGFQEAHDLYLTLCGITCNAVRALRALQTGGGK
jgi:hypothetical protein